MTQDLLDVSQLAVSFGGVRAVAGTDLTVPEGAIVGLIGPNGAGKTTCIDAVTGFVACRGRVTFAGHDVTAEAPFRRVRRGLARTWQSNELFDDLTVAQNLFVAANPRARRRWLDGRAAGRQRPASDPTAELELLGLRGMADRLPLELSHGHRKLVGIARALASSPRLLCLDEPAAGLSSVESNQLRRHLRAIAGTGVTMLLVDHDMGLVLDLCDLVHVIDQGKVIAAGPPEVVVQEAAVVEAYLGTAAVEGAP